MRSSNDLWARDISEWTAAQRQAPLCLTNSAFGEFSAQFRTLPIDKDEWFRTLATLQSDIKPRTMEFQALTIQNWHLDLLFQSGLLNELETFSLNQCTLFEYAWLSMQDCLRNAPYLLELNLTGLASFPDTLDLSVDFISQLTLLKKLTLNMAADARFNVPAFLMQLLLRISEHPSLEWVKLEMPEHSENAALRLFKTQAWRCVGRGKPVSVYVGNNPEPVVVGVKQKWIDVALINFKPAIEDPFAECSFRKFTLLNTCPKAETPPLHQLFYPQISPIWSFDFYSALNLKNAAESIQEALLLILATKKEALKNEMFRNLLGKYSVIQELSLPDQAVTQTLARQGYLSTLEANLIGFNSYADFTSIAGTYAKELSTIEKLIRGTSLCLKFTSAPWLSTEILEIPFLVLGCEKTALQEAPCFLLEDGGVFLLQNNILKRKSTD